MNAAVWLGAAVFFTFGVGPAFFSPDMQSLLGAKNFPYYSGAIAEIVLRRYYHLSLACGVVALIHLFAQWLYMGRPARKFSLGLLVTLMALTLIGGNLFQPKLKELHGRKYSMSVPAADRESASRSFKIIHAIAQMLNVVALGGLVVYVWRVGNPPDTLKFVSSVKFRD